MVGTSQPSECLSPLLTCLQDNTSPNEDKTDAYLRLAEDLAKEDKQFIDEVCNISGKLMSLLKRDMICSKTDLSQAALQAIGYCLYQEQIISSLKESEMENMIEDICNVITNSTDKNLCTRALWGLGKQHIAVHVVEKKIPVILKSVEHALLNFASPTVQKEALEVIYRMLNQLSTEAMTSTAEEWVKFVYPLLISSAHKIREKALVILEMGLQPILLARENIVAVLISDLKGGLLSGLTKCFSEKKEVFVLRTWTILITILGEAFHKSGSLINTMLKIPEQGFRSTLPGVQTMSYNAWIALIDNFALSPSFLGSLKKIKLLMMPLLLCSSKTVHKDIELSRLQVWWHLICTIKTNYTDVIFAEICLPFLQYYFNIDIENNATPGAATKDGMHLILPVTPVAPHKTSSVGTPAISTPGKNGPKRKTITLNKGKLSDAFVKQLMLLCCEMFMEIVAVNKTEHHKHKELSGNVTVVLSEHLGAPILSSSFFQEHELLFLATVKSALRSCGSYLEESVSLSIWSNIIDRVIDLQNGKNGGLNDIDTFLGPLFVTAHDLMMCSALKPNVTLKCLEVLVDIPPRFLLHSFSTLSSLCCQGKPVFLLTDILFNQLPSFTGFYVDERFHIVFESLIDICLEAPSRQLNNVYTVWTSFENLFSTVSNVEDLWRFWNKVTDSVSLYVTKTSDVNQGDALDHDFTLMISLLTCPFKHLFSGGLPGATAKELNRDLADFFLLFCRCASLVATAEANSSIEELASHLLTVVSVDKCKNANFLDGICNVINVMVESIDFTALASIPTLSTRSNLSPVHKVKHAKNTLGKLNSLVLLSAKVLTLSYQVDQDSSGSSVVAPALIVLAGALSKLFAHLTISDQMKACIRILAKPLTLFISHSKASFHVNEVRSSDKKSFNTKFFLKIEKLWADILTCLQSRYAEDYDSNLLIAMTELLESTFCHCRRQFRNQTIMFWNATFAHADYLDYPEGLRPCLQKVLEKTPLILPGWNKAKVLPFDAPATIQECEETTPKENIIKPQVIVANSPKRKHASSSPGKFKGSFLHKAFSSDKNDVLSPFKKNLESSASKRKSPGGGNVRRKLPLSLDVADDQDFVVIAPSPKKKRLLTEHQKDVIKAKKMECVHPPLYNMLDQSQDGTRFSQLSQLSSESLSQPFVPANQDDGATNNLQGGNLDNRGEFSKDVTQLETTSDKKSTILDADSVEPVHVGGSCDQNDEPMTVEQDASPEFIPSSQTTSVRENSNRRSIIPFQSLAIKRVLPGACVEQVTDAILSKLPAENNIVEETLEKDIAEDVDTNNEQKIEQSVDGNITENTVPVTSPISNRTRLRRKSSEPISQQINTKDASLQSTLDEDEQEKGDTLKTSESTSHASKEQDTQLFDTQILEETRKRNDKREDIIQHEDNAPSSPVYSMKLVHSKHPSFGSPLRLPTRGFNSPAASPTTGILKRCTKGNPDTPSPPGKTRRVSFAFPLKEEKEFSNDLLEDVIDQITKDTGQEEPSYTSIKVTPTKSAAEIIPSNDCVFPDLVECLTPVEQILPSLATSRWSRGLGHLVHAQNIRTIGNLSALTEDQVNKLPIRSPKVSTLRRVLRNFRETRGSKSTKESNQREMKTVVEADERVENEVSSSIGDTIINSCSTDKQINNSEKTMKKDKQINNSDEKNDIGCEEEVYVLAKENSNDCLEDNKSEAALGKMESACSEPELPFQNEKMLTPRRSRAHVKPTTLFDTEPEQNVNLAAENNDTETPPVKLLQTKPQLLVSEDVESAFSDVENIDEPTEKMDVLNENLIDANTFADQLIDTDITSPRKEENVSDVMDAESVIAPQDVINPFVEAVGDLLKPKTQYELAQLPLNALFLCHDQLTTVLSNIVASIKTKCNQNL